MEVTLIRATKIQDIKPPIVGTTVSEVNGRRIGPVGILGEGTDLIEQLDASRAGLCLARGPWIR
jgi:hypothetical protein